MTDISALYGGSRGETREFQFVRGEYAITGERVPYFGINMTVNEAKMHLRLAQDLAVNEDDPINLEELMQRDVVDDRAENEIAQYLLAPNRLKFFNSLTVVLMPTGPGGQPLMEFPQENSVAVEASENVTVTQVGPVAIRSLDGTNFGFIKWRLDGATGVIIDGQHRFRALEKVSRTSPQLLKPDVTSLPILLLILDARAGFTPTLGGPQQIVKASRAIFTDINKYAVKVSAEREYLLDDLSLTAVAMRALLTPGIGGTTAGRLQEIPARIPLSLVDWLRPRQTKFDDSYHMTTIQALHQLVAEVLQAPTPSSSNHDALRQWLDRLVARVEIADRAWGIDEIYDRLKKAKDEELPFSLTASEVRIVAENFALGLGQAISLPLLHLKPYRQLIDGYLANGLLGTSRELWLGQGLKARENYRRQFSDDPENDASEASLRVKREFRLAYLVVFQRAFVVAAREVAEIWPELDAQWSAGGTREGVLLHWIGRFNNLVAPLLASPDFWLGTAVKSTGDIDFGQNAKNAVMGLVLLLTLPGDEPPTPLDDSNESILSGDPRDETLSLLDGDPLRVVDADSGQLQAVEHWRSLVDSIRAGRARGGDLGQLRRAAARAYRNGLRRYVEDVATVNGRNLDEVQVAYLVIAHGGRRFANIPSPLAAESLDLETDEVTGS